MKDFLDKYLVIPKLIVACLGIFIALFITPKWFMILLTIYFIIVAIRFLFIKKDELDKKDKEESTPFFFKLKIGKKKKKEIINE